MVGETGRAMVAGAAGGLLRWLGQERRRLRDGVLAVASGSIAALYLAPVVIAVLAAMGLDIGTGPATERSAGFLAGLAGMSVAKVLIAAVETWAGRAGQGGGHGQP
jgi:hypothetical protein